MWRRRRHWFAFAEDTPVARDGHDGGCVLAGVSEVLVSEEWWKSDISIDMPLARRRRTPPQAPPTRG